MNADPAASGRSGSLRGILWGGAIAGVLDITFACIFYGSMRGRSPVTVLHSVASGLLGAKASEGGPAIAALGLVLHFVIAFGAATVFYLASRKIPFLLKHAVVSGLIFGIGVYFFMNLVVLPLSAYPRTITFPLRAVIPGLLAHMFLIGLSISLAVRRFSAEPQLTSSSDGGGSSARRRSSSSQRA
jgi:hypothetical protein